MALYSIVSICAGIGGIDLGLRLAIPEARTILYVEREITSAEKLVARFEDGTLDAAPVWSDLRSFSGKPWRGRVDILTAGYPCQPFSCAGKRLAEKDPRHLWPEVARIVREMQPGQVFLENVAGHLRLGFLEVAQELRRMGYRCAAGLFTASEVGAPHKRQRLFCLAERADRRRGELRQSSGGDGFADGSGAEPENTARFSEHRQARQDGGRRRGVCQAGHELADAGFGLLPVPRRGTQGRTGTRSAGAVLAYAQSSNRRPGSESEPEEPRIGRRRLSGNGAGMASLPIFPPGPGDLDAWRELLGRDASLEPALRGTSHGASSRVDRLRALGNGVIPIVAALAYRSLSAALAGQPLNERMAA